MIVVSQTGSDAMTRKLTGREIAADIAARLRAGEYRPGAQLHYEQLMDLYAVSRSTIQRAMARLETLGLVEYQPGRGMFVRDHPDG